MTMPWHSEADMQCRRRILQEILNFFVLCPAVCQTPEWRTRFPDFLRRLELTLYLNADCREEYADSSTVVDRLRSVTLHLQRQRVEQMQRAACRAGGPQRAHLLAHRGGIPSGLVAPRSVQREVADLSRGLRDLRTRSGGQVDPSGLVGPDSLEPQMLGGIEVSRDDVVSDGHEGSMSPASGALYGGVPRSGPKAGGYGPPSPSMLGAGGETTSRGVVPGLVAHGGGIETRDLRRSVSMSEAYSYVSVGGELGGSESTVFAYGHPFVRPTQSTGARGGEGFSYDHGMQHFEPTELCFTSGADIGGVPMDSDAPNAVLMDHGPGGRVPSPGFGGQQRPDIRSPRAGHGFVLAASRDVQSLGVGHGGANAGGQLQLGSPSVTSHEMQGSLAAEQLNVPTEASGAYTLPVAEGIDHNPSKLYRSLSAAGALSPK